MFEQAKESSWLYHPKIKIDLSPQELVISVIKSKCLEVFKVLCILFINFASKSVLTEYWLFQGDIGYNLKPQIGEWKVENGVLRLNIQFIVRPSMEKILLQERGSGLRAIGNAQNCTIRWHFLLKDSWSFVFFSP